MNFIKDAAIFGDKWKLADFTDGLAIMRLPLEVYLQQKETMQKGISGMKSLAASGKIRLVRERLGITKEPRKK